MFVVTLSPFAVLVCDQTDFINIMQSKTNRLAMVVCEVKERLFPICDVIRTKPLKKREISSKYERNLHKTT